MNDQEANEIKIRRLEREKQELTDLVATLQERNIELERQIDALRSVVRTYRVRGRA